MNYDQLKTFLSIVETKNFNRTSELLFISQPTVTARIKVLESEVGQPLFVRTNKFVELTAAGRQFLPYAAEMYRTMTDCRTAMKNYDYDGEIINISAPATCWDYGPMRRSIVKYAAKHPDTSLNLLRNVSVETLSLLQAEEIDIGVVYVLPNSPDYTVIPYFSEELLLLASPKLNLPPQGDFLKSSGELPSLVRPRYAALVSQLVEDSLYMLPGRITCDHPALYFEFVKECFGIGLLQTSIAADSIAKGELEIVDCDYNKQPLLHKNYIVVHRAKEQHYQGLIDALLGDL